MLCIISVILALIESSLPLSNASMIVILPFFAYTASMKRTYFTIWLVIISLLMSLQTDNFVRIFISLVVGYFILDFFYINIGYNRRNTFFLSLIEAGLYAVINYKNLSIYWVIGNFIGFLIMNYIYAKRKHVNSVDNR